jgi:hypothetical protein
MSEDIRSLVEQFVANVETLVRKQALESVQAAFGLTPGKPAKPSASKPSTGPTKPSVSKPAPEGQRARRSAKDIEAEANRLLIAIKAKPGSNIEALKIASKVSNPDIPVKTLLAAKRIRKTGEKRSTRYFPA